MGKAQKMTSLLGKKQKIEKELMPWKVEAQDASIVRRELKKRVSLLKALAMKQYKQRRNK